MKIQKSLLKSKLILLLFLAANLLFAETRLLDKRITIEFKDVQIEKAIILLNKKLNRIFSFKNDIFPRNKTVTLKVTEAPLREILDKILNGTKIKYFEFGKQIILKLVDSERPDKSEIDIDRLNSNQIKPFNRESLAVINAPYLKNNSEVYSSPNLLKGIQRKSEISKRFDLFIDTPYQNLTLSDGSPIHDPSIISQLISNQKEENSNLELKGCHTIFISTGFKSNSNTVITSITGVEIKTGFTGSIAYGYWFDNEWALNLLAGVFGVESNISVNNVSTKSIIPILLGIRYYPSFLSIGNVGRVYGGINAGVYMGTGTKITNLLLNESVVETVFGFQPVIGIDFFLTDWFEIGSGISYDVVSGFSETVSSKSNYSGPELTVNFGIVF
jgi:hypothetical protein